MTLRRRCLALAVLLAHTRQRQCGGLEPVGCDQDVPELAGLRSRVVPVDGRGEPHKIGTDRHPGVGPVQLHAADKDIPPCRTGALARFLFTAGRSFEARFTTFRRHRKLLILDPYPPICMPLMVLGSVAGAAPERGICAGVPGRCPSALQCPCASVSVWPFATPFTIFQNIGQA